MSPPQVQTLVLIPTPMEARIVDEMVDGSDGLHPLRSLDVVTAICGFGPVVAAARSADLIARHRPQRVFLLGIAGVYAGGHGDAPAVGTACEFAEVGCHGVGAGSGPDFRSAAQLGWTALELPGGERIGDRITLARDSKTRPNGAASRLLLTVCSASADTTDVDQRRREFPDAVAEDMEAFAVAVSCRLAGVPLRVIRGISNLAGDREHSRWQTRAAMIAAVNRIQDELGHAEDDSTSS